MNYYQHNIGDYRRDTSHLTLLEHGVYRQLIDSYYLAEQQIPLETEVVFRRLCAKTDDEKSAVQIILSEFFTRTETGWVHKRCEEEIAAYQAKAGRARDNGKLGGRPKKTKAVISNNPEITGSKANHKPITINHKPTKVKSISAFAPPIPQDLLADWLQIRKAKRAGPVTETAWRGIEREAAKAGIAAEQAVRICCERGWQSFKADWDWRGVWIQKQGGTLSREEGRAAAARSIFKGEVYEQQPIDGTAKRVA